MLRDSFNNRKNKAKKKAFFVSRKDVQTICCFFCFNRGRGYYIPRVFLTDRFLIFRGLNRERKDQDTTHFSASFCDCPEVAEDGPARRLAQATASFGTYDILTPP